MKKNEFRKFNLIDQIIDKLNIKNINVPTQIQNEVIPKILNEKDVIAQSKTGTGKTIAFLLPLINLAITKNHKILIIAPTKELANQIHKEVSFFIKDTKLNSILLISGISIDNQISKLKKNIDIIIGVPGRILKLNETGKLKLSQFKKLVLDEADFLIDLGFLEDLKKIFKLLKNINQLMVFSATLSNKTKKVIDLINNQKISVRVDAKNSLPNNILNYFMPVEDENRENSLFNILSIINPYLSIIFVRTKDICNYLYTKLKEKKYNCTYINGDLSSSKRKKAASEFIKGKVQYLIATDLASRGLDVEGITHIINYNLPVNELDYLHRAGRTGRMNDDGIVYSLCNKLDEGYLKKYSHNLSFKIEPIIIKNGKINIDKKYKGVKPRFNLKELSIMNKKKEITKNVDKKKRRKRYR